MKLAFAADLHLSPLIWKDQPEVAGDAYYAWWQIVDVCMEQKVDALILGGDIWQLSRPDSDSIMQFMHGVDKLEAAGIAVLAIQGQHEKADPPWIGLHKHVQQLDVSRAQFGIGSSAITVGGFSHKPADLLEKRLKDFGDVDILVVHQLAKQVIPFDGEWDFDLDWVPDNVKLVLAGDYHAPVNHGRLYYSGSTHMRAMDQLTERSFLLINSKLEVTRHPLQNRIVDVYELHNEEHMEEAVAGITQERDLRPKPIDRPIIYAKIFAEIPHVIERLQRACHEAPDRPILMTKVFGGVEVIDNISVPSGEITMEACLSQAIDREKDSELYGFVLDLLQSSDPAEICDARKKELGL